MIVKQSFGFEAAHRLPFHTGKCATLHGHSYRFTCALERPVDRLTGLTIDFFDIEAAVEKAVLEHWDHRNLNEHMENPTAERIVVEIWRRLERALPGLKEIELWETPESSVVYRGEAESA